MRHRGTHVGNFFLGDKEAGEEFTSEDEEVLMLFAAQAATAIGQCPHLPRRAAGPRGPGGADRYLAGGCRGLRGGTAVRAVSINQEARRIVDGLRIPGRSPEELLEVVTCQRCGWTRGIPRRVPPGAAVGQRRDGARRGDRALGTRRPAREDAGQRHANPFCGGQSRVRRGHHAGSGAAGGSRTDAGRIPEHGKPRAASAAGRDQGLGRDRAGGLTGAGRGRGAASSFGSSRGRRTGWTA